MARMHSRAKGTSRSTKPSRPAKTSWVRYKGKEVELIVSKLAKEGKSQSEIGIIMRDTYGIPSIRIFTEKKISKILAEKKLSPELPEDLMALIRKSLAVRKHMETNRQDKTAKRGLQLTDAKINRLARYYKKAGKLPADWKYDPSTIRVFM